MSASLALSFTSELPNLERLAQFCFRHLKPEAREEAVQNTIALAWKALARLTERGLANDPDRLRHVLHFAVKQTKAGRMPQGQIKERDAFQLSRSQNGSSLGINLDGFVSHNTPIPERVAFRLDTVAFLATLSDRQRAIAGDLMEGQTTGEVARQHGVTSGAISQFRRRFRQQYEAFIAA